MERVIRVKGTGKVATPPDLVEISLTINGISKNYEKAMKQAEEKLSHFKDDLLSLGFKEEDLKTANFQVNTNYESIRDENNQYKSVFTGFTCRHDLLLSFDFTKEKLADVLNVLSQGEKELEFRLNFTVKDPESLTEKLLESAAKNARKKAEILCAASKVTLGELVNIDYSWEEISLYSDTNFRMPNQLMGKSAVMEANVAFQPKDVESTDTATFIWAIKS